jgi:hypothetical protein
MACYVNDPENETAYITTISILEKYKGQGLGMMLLKDCIDFAKNNGFKKVKLEVSKINTAAISFYEKYDIKPTSENDKQHDISITTALKKMGRISSNKSYQFPLKNSNILVAIGYGDKKITELPKWKKLIDFNVFGNYQCMPENYFIPSTDYFAHTYSNPKVSQDSTIILIPLDSAFVHGYNELGNYTMLYNSIEPGFKRKAGFIRQSIFELKRRFDCTGIYGVNQYKYEYNKYERLGTINNIEYMPGVYFLPDYFKIKAINGLTLEEFAKKQCEK